MKNTQELAGTFTLTVTDNNGKEYNTIIKKGSIEERKKIHLTIGTDDYFPLAEQFIKNNLVSGDNLFADEEALYAATTRLMEVVTFNAAKLVDTPEGINAAFSIEATDTNGNTLLAHFEKPSVQVKKKLFTMLTKGVDNPFTLGEVMVLECFLEGDELNNDAEVLASAAMILSSYIESYNIVIKKN
ncbi:hypothetical protein ABID22_000132 [Pontibacter aydingkolensis]|uniref:Uncharacterized protein n=1 Tax=Pontibacter aydingkolensis TaxID=1911536 RepID=A0ABS7CQX3_9BACT|nr:hypothetical protein [Pontibacter aydingkolensis]MBW7466200.1 hypothetical protein [Pontibacter aydingkolensis]